MVVINTPYFNNDKQVLCELFGEKHFVVVKKPTLKELADYIYEIIKSHDLSDSEDVHICTNGIGNVIRDYLIASGCSLTERKIQNYPIVGCNE